MAEYDYIIVGAGSAGCVLANRLSEESDVSVLLLEAGGRDSHPGIHIPLAMRSIFDRPAINWGTDPNRNPIATAAGLRSRAERCWAGHHRSTP